MKKIGRKIVENLAGFVDKYIPTKAGAQAGGFGFQKSKAGPKAASGQAQGPAWPGFWPQAGASTSLARTST